MDELSIEEALAIFNPALSDEELEQAIIKKYDVDMHDLVRKDNVESVKKIVSAINSGEQKIDVSFQDVICNYPDISLCEPERVYVNSDAGFDPQSASFLIHEFLLPIEMVKLNGEVKGWDLGEISDIENTALIASKDKNIDIQKDTREGVEVLNETGKITIWEYYGYFDINGDGENEKCIITTAPDFDKVLRKISLPFYSGKYPFVKLFYELCDDRWFSHRGIPEILEEHRKRNRYTALSEDRPADHKKRSPICP